MRWYLSVNGSLTAIMKEFNIEIYKQGDLYIQHLKILNKNVVSKSIDHPNDLVRYGSRRSYNIPINNIRGSIPTFFLN